jgi:hypothetical protein
MAKTVSVVPIPTSIINNYKVGGYYIGILGEGGLGVGYPAALGSLKDSIVRVPARNPELNEKPPTVYEVFAKLSTGDYVTNLKKYLFHFHLFNKEIKIMDEWMRVTAPKVNYVAPGACEAVNLGGYFGFFYLNGPKSQPAKIINSESDPDTLATEFAVGGDMADIKLTNIPRLGSCFDSLPIVRFAHSTANSNLKGIMTVGLQLNKKSSSETWALKCRVEVDLDFSLTVDNKNVSVVSYAKCTSTGVLQQVRSYYCYSLEINKDISETDLEDAASSLLGVGDYWVFDMKYNTNLTPVQMLYFENLTDNWENRLNYPFYTKPLDPYVELIPTKNDPGCASSGSLPATWNTYQDNKHGILSEIQSSYRRSILSNIATKCGNIKSTGSGASLTMPSNQMIYSIVHDNLSETRAFSQPLDFANYIKINDVKYKKKSDGSYTVDISAEMKGNNAFGCVGYTWKIEEGGYDTVIKSGSGASVSPGNGYELYNTRYSDGGSIKSVTLTYAGSFVSRPNVTIVGDGSGATVALLDRYVVTEDESEIERYEILGIVVTNRGSGYTYANVKFTQDPKVPLGHVYVVVNGSIRLYTLENFGLCTTDDECEMAYAYAEIVFPIDGNATWVRFDREKDYTYANISGSMLTAANLELNVRDVEKVVRISATDTTGVEFYTYTSLFKWIDPDERLTYCIYSCNPPLATKIGGVGVVIDLEMGDLYNIADILSGAAKAYVNKTNPSTTGQDIYNGKNIIRVGGGSGITEDYVGPLYIFNKATNTLLYTIPKAISSSCYMKYNVKI